MQEQGSSNIILLLDGQAPSVATLAPYLPNASLIVAADGAAQYALQYGITPNVIIGDLDSLDEETRSRFQNTKIIKESDQNSNDFEKTLQYLINNGETRMLTIFGLHGKQLDHTLSNLSVLARYRDLFTQLVVVDDMQKHYLLTEKYPKIELFISKETFISLTPLPKACNVTTYGLQFPIREENMEFGNREGLSNRANSSDGIKITIGRGTLLVSHSYAQ